MRFSIGLAASSTLALVVAGCSSPNPLGGLPQFGAAADAGSTGPSSNAPGDDNAGDDDGTSNGHGSTPSPRPPPGTPLYPDAGSTPSDDGGAPAIDGAALVSDSSAPTTDSGAPSALLVRCVADLNSYRSQAGVSALTESSALEAYGALAAASDAQSGTTHGYFTANHGNGVSAAESELPAWPLNQYASTSDLIDQGVAAIFNQGPGAAPYDNLVNATFTQAGCGVTTTTDGNVWVTFEYK